MQLCSCCTCSPTESYQICVLQQILPELANFQRDSDPAVRKWLAECLEDAGKTNPDPAILHAALAVLHSLIEDATAAVAKRAVAGCSVLFRKAFAAVLEGSRTAGFPAHFEHLWTQALQVDSLSNSSPNNVVITSACAAVIQIAKLRSSTVGGDSAG